MNSPFRLAVVNSHPIQYFAPRYAYLNRDPNLGVTALYYSDASLRGEMDRGIKQAVTWHVDFLSGYRSVFLGTQARRRILNGFWSLICPEVWTEIRRGGYDAVLLHGYNFAVNLLALAAAKSKGLPVTVSKKVGCVPDLVKQGVNGYHIEACDGGSLAIALGRLLLDGEARRRMGAAGLNMIRKWSYEQCHQGITAALEASMRAA